MAPVLDDGSIQVNIAEIKLIFKFLSVKMMVKLQLAIAENEKFKILLGAMLKPMKIIF